jgi:MFS family permease
MRWFRTRSAPVEVVHVVEDVIARRLEEQAQAVSNAERRVRRQIIGFGLFSLVVFAFVVVLSYLVNLTVFVVRHGLAASRPSPLTLVTISVTSSDAFVVVGSLLALVSAIAIAQQAATTPVVGDVAGIAQAMAWQSATSAIALVAGMLAMQVALSQWVAGDGAARWASHLFAALLGLLTLSMAATLRQWSDQSIRNAMRRRQLTEKIRVLSLAVNRLPRATVVRQSANLTASQAVRNYLLPLGELALPGGILFTVCIVITAYGGDPDPRNWQLILDFFASTGASLVLTTIGALLACSARNERVQRAWWQLAVPVGFGLLWYVVTLGAMTILIIGALRLNAPQNWAYVAYIGYLAAVPLVMYLLSGRSSRWPANFVNLVVRQAIQRDTEELQVKLSQLDAET